MPNFTLVFLDNTKKVLKASTKDEMIGNFCKEDCTLFQEQVKEIHWQEENVHFIEDIRTGEITESIVTFKKSL